uniref:Ig-like domain-containing protein n=1 Tax=Seriola lalandi dorsalis TaxID=1841481 RepID=A0A3B4YC24_SERLL
MISWSWSLHPNCKGEDRVIQPTADVTAAEGHTVTLDCKFETTDSFPYLFWYKQEENDFPQYMIKSFSKEVDISPEFMKERFNAEVNNKSVPLKIQKLQVSDSAVYYCALQPTVTGNTKTLYKNLWKSVTLSCQYQTGSEYPALYWYRHDSDLQAPQFILYKGAKSRSALQYIPDDRYQSETTATSTELTISRLTLNDAALYYCALETQ